MNRRTIRVCQECGEQFYGSQDMHYCQECARKRKKDVVRPRICIDCGNEFLGGPRARRCPACADIARREAQVARRKNGTSRPLGSTDQCLICGKDYIVKSGRQKYCPDCQRDAMLGWQKEHKKGYAAESGQNKKKQERRKNQEKICAYCGRTFSTSTASNLCSDYCRKEQNKLNSCKADIKKGNHRNLQEYLDKRDAYREKVKAGQA